MQILCNYCGKPAKLVFGSELYPNWPHLCRKLFWRCEPCGAHVGCHAPSAYNKGQCDIPLGPLANSSTRQARSAAHLAFDGIWERNIMTRSAAYAWLAKQLNIPIEACHIGHFDEATCERVQQICDLWWRERSAPRSAANFSTSKGNQDD